MKWVVDQIVLRQRQTFRLPAQMAGVRLFTISGLHGGAAGRIKLEHGLSLNQEECTGEKEPASGCASGCRLIRVRSGVGWDRGRTTTAATGGSGSPATSWTGIHMGGRILVSGGTPLPLACRVLDSCAIWRGTLGWSPSRRTPFLCRLLGWRSRPPRTRPSLGSGT